MDEHVIKKSRLNRIFHGSFEVMLLLKALNGLMEIAGGVLLTFLTPDRMNRFMALITRRELLEDPNDLFMNLLLKISGSFSIDKQHFLIFYLLTHGVVKLIIITLLWRRKLWAYPISIGVFLFFITYQMHKYAQSPSVMYIALTILDSILIFLTFMEYRNLKQQRGIAQ